MMWAAIENWALVAEIVHNNNNTITGKSSSAFNQQTNPSQKLRIHLGFDNFAFQHPSEGLKKLFKLLLLALLPVAALAFNGSRFCINDAPQS